MTDRWIDKRQTSTPNAPPRGTNKTQIVSKLTADFEVPTVIRQSALARTGKLHKKASFEMCLKIPEVEVFVKT